MPDHIYEILSLAMRYVFTLLGVLIVWRAFSWLRKDRRLKHKRLRQLPDAGTIGVLTVEAGSDELPEGSIIPVPSEGVLGFLRTCDIVVPVEGVEREHIDFTFRNGHGLYVYPRRGCSFQLDGMDVQTRRDARSTPMQHGSVITLGQATLRLGVFEGLDVPTRWAMVAEEPMEELPLQPLLPPDGMPLPPPPAPWPLPPRQPLYPPDELRYAPYPDAEAPGGHSSSLPPVPPPAWPLADVPADPVRRPPYDN